MAAMDIVEQLKKFSNSVQFWASHLKQHTTNYLDCYWKESQQSGNGKIDYPRWAYLPRRDRQQIYDWLEFHKGVEYAKAFKGRVDKLEKEIKVFADKFLGNDGYLNAPDPLKLHDLIEDDCDRLEIKASSLIRYINFVSQELGIQNNNAKIENTGTAIENDTGEGWHIENGQVFYNGNELQFPTGNIQEVLKKLVNSQGQTVAYANFGGISKLKNHIVEIRKLIKALPFWIETKTGEGYVLRKK